MKAKDLKNILIPLELGDKTYKIAFDFNAMAELDDVYGDFNKAIKAINGNNGKLKAIRALVYSAIKPRYEEITLIKVGELLTPIMTDDDMANYLMTQLTKAIELAMPNQEDMGE